MGKEEFDRLEYRYISTTAPSVNCFGKEIKYEKPWVTTVYLGGIDDFLHGVALKLRFFSEYRNAKPFIIPNNEPAILELKTGDGESGSLRRRKYRVDIPFGKAVSLLKNTHDFRKLIHYSCKGSDEPFPAKLLHDICLKEGVTGFTPRGATSYHRKHFDLREGRLTVDRDLTYWGLTNYFKDWYLYPISKCSKDIILEVKMPFVGSKDSKRVFSIFNSYTPSPAKFDCLKELVNMSGLKHGIVSFGLSGTAKEGTWKMLERECKLDFSVDVRNLVNKFYLDQKKYSLSQVYVHISYQQFILVGENGICIMGRKGKDEPEVVKVKTVVSKEANVLSRDERIFPYSEESIKKAVLMVGGDSKMTYTTSPPFIRRRVQRNVLCRNSRNIFNIYVDCCETEGCKIKPLYQCEIEYHGTLVRDLGKYTASQSIDCDFSQLIAVFIDFFKKQRVEPALALTTKYSWIKGVTI